MPSIKIEGKRILLIFKSLF